MKYVILINGPAGAGKDTFISMVTAIADIKYRFENINVSSLSAADRIKYAARTLGWDSKKDDKSRAMLSELKDFADKHFNTTLIHIFTVIDGRDSFRARGVKYIDVGEIIDFKETIDSKETHPAIDVIFVCVRESKDARAIYDHYEDDPNVKVSGVYVSRAGIDQVSSSHADIEAQSRDSYLFPYLVCNYGTLGELMDEAEAFLDGLIAGRTTC